MKIKILVFFTVIFILFTCSPVSGACGDPDQLERAKREIRTNPEIAVSIYETALRKCRDNRDILYNLSLAHYAGGNAEEAVDILESVRRMEPDAPDVINTLSWILIDNEIDADKGIRLAKKGLKIVKSPQLMDTLGWGYYRKGERKRAAGLFKKAMKQADPDFLPTIKQHLAMAAQKKDKNGPKITILYPEHFQTKSLRDGIYSTDESKITIRGKAEDETGIASIFINEEEAGLSEDGEFWHTVILAKKQNKFVIEAMDGKKNKSSITIEIARKFDIPPPMFKPKAISGLYAKSYAVIIGIDKYKNLPKTKHLSYPVRDAKALEKILRQRYLFEDIYPLYNEEATKDEIEKLVYGTLSNTELNDSVFFFFSGHGYTVKSSYNDLGYLIPYDGSFEQKEMGKNISMTALRTDYSNVIKAKHIYYVMDSCFSGILLTKSGNGKKTEYNYDYLEEITNTRVRLAQTAGKKDEKVLEKGPLGYSPLAGRFLKALCDTDGFITAKQIGGEIPGKVLIDAKWGGHVQTPQFGILNGSGDYVFIPKDFSNKGGTGDPCESLNEKF